MGGFEAGDYERGFKLKNFKSVFWTQRSCEPKDYQGGVEAGGYERGYEPRVYQWGLWTQGLSKGDLNPGGLKLRIRLDIFKYLQISWNFQIYQHLFSSELRWGIHHKLSVSLGLVCDGTIFSWDMLDLNSILVTCTGYFYHLKVARAQTARLYLILENTYVIIVW